jgi:large subunit ribosomal protein L21
MAESYAIVESGGKQYRAEKGATLLVDRLPADEGSKVNLRAVMFRGDKETVLEADKLEKVKVEATVAGHVRGEKIRIFKYRPKKGYRKRAGHRSELTELEVTEVKMLTRKPAARPAEKKDEEPKEAAEKKPAAKKPAARKPAAKKPAAKKPAARRTSTTQKKESSDGS